LFAACGFVGGEYVLKKEDGKTWCKVALNFGGFIIVGGIPVRHRFFASSPETARMSLIA
jgi:hypothetical protein